MQNNPKPTELTILNYIEQNAEATQRELSAHAGVSLGSINILLKKMIKKGLIKIEKLQPNSIKYFLTPAGIANKIERTYNYISRTYNEIQGFRNGIVAVADTVASTHNLETVIFFGEHDEMYRLIRDLQTMEAFKHNIEHYSSVKQLTENNKEKNPVLIWSHEAEELLLQEDIRTVNIMRTLVI
jgi:DNA-binding Lrp family transcriptional regulator